MAAQCGLIVFARDGEVFANSRDVAAFFEKSVSHVHEAIKNLISQERSLGLSNFRPFETNDLTGESIHHYEMDRDGFTLLCMGFTGSKALKWKLRHIEAFNAMEAEGDGETAYFGRRDLPQSAAYKSLLRDRRERCL